MAWREPMEAITLLLPVTISVAEGTFGSSSVVAVRIRWAIGDPVGSHGSGVGQWAKKM